MNTEQNISCTEDLKPASGKNEPELITLSILRPQNAASSAILKLSDI